MGLGTDGFSHWGQDVCLQHTAVLYTITTSVVDKESNSDSSKVGTSLSTNEVRASPLA